MTGDEDDRKGLLAVGEFGLKVETASAGQAYVQNQTNRAIRPSRGKKFGH